ncbi:hypothetical protein IWQ60_010516 [Tieghemiomyces parasiticus]|uniref:RlpA-like protein double-psi beta-barrel domain-containing protein n=1 Tax=Tieghemiomyces parasiticus TaxID=78921 RepID=A0A9W7ZQL8_9FUNG|nr:hypothetical protein IWQ60_010516 [Tieghemiomyces parasiticus]
MAGSISKLCVLTLGLLVLPSQARLTPYSNALSSDEFSRSGNTGPYEYLRPVARKHDPYGYSTKARSTNSKPLALAPKRYRSSSSATQDKDHIRALVRKYMRLMYRDMEVTGGGGGRGKTSRFDDLVAPTIGRSASRRQAALRRDHRLRRNRDRLMGRFRKGPRESMSPRAKEILTPLATSPPTPKKPASVAPLPPKMVNPVVSELLKPTTTSLKTPVKTQPEKPQPQSLPKPEPRPEPVVAPAAPAAAPIAPILDPVVEPAVTPVDPPTPAAQPASGQLFSGDGTFYDDQGYGSCGNVIDHSIPHVALSILRRGPNVVNPNHDPVCGQMVEITGPKGTARAVVDDTCMGCKVDDIDLSPVLYDQVIGDRNIGRTNVSWQFV